MVLYIYYIRKEQDFVNLEQRFYEQYNNIQELLREKDELIETMKILEENNQKLKVFLIFRMILAFLFDFYKESMIYNESNHQKNLVKLKKKLTEKEIEIKYLQTEKNFLYNDRKTNNNSK